MKNLRAILVSVNYDDLLAITLPYNRHHFDEVMVVTSSTDEATVKVALENRARVCVTDAFYDDGAWFNKWKALEYGLDMFGRHGILCIMDSDILWPKFLPDTEYLKGVLYSPRRRLWLDITQEIPPEHHWVDLPVGYDQEFAGYTQIFHADDPILPDPPWHQLDWIHAGGADSFFQMLWDRHNKIRPRWECLHLGPPGTNWCGRSITRTNGELPDGANKNRYRLRQILNWRTNGGNRRSGRPYGLERLPEGT